MLHHHPVHAFLLPQVDGGWLVAAVLLQVLDATLTQLGTLIFCLDGLCSLQDTHAQKKQDIYEKLNMHQDKNYCFYRYRLSVQSFNGTLIGYFGEKNEVN